MQRASWSRARVDASLIPLQHQKADGQDKNNVGTDENFAQRTSPYFVHVNYNVCLTPCDDMLRSRLIIHIGRKVLRFFCMKFV
jgi:hypothetical protein